MTAKGLRFIALCGFSWIFSANGFPTQTPRRSPSFHKVNINSLSSDIPSTVAKSKILLSFHAMILKSKLSSFEDGDYYDDEVYQSASRAKKNYICETSRKEDKNYDHADYYYGEDIYNIDNHLNQRDRLNFPKPRNRRQADSFSTYSDSHQSRQEPEKSKDVTKRRTRLRQEAGRARSINYPHSSVSSRRRRYRSKGSSLPSMVEDFNRFVRYSFDDRKLSEFDLFMDGLKGSSNDGRYYEENFNEEKLDNNSQDTDEIDYDYEYEEVTEFDMYERSQLSSQKTENFQESLKTSVEKLNSALDETAKGSKHRSTSKKQLEYEVGEYTDLNPSKDDTYEYDDEGYEDELPIYGRKTKRESLEPAAISSWFAEDVGGRNDEIIPWLESKQQSSLLVDFFDKIFQVDSDDTNMKAEEYYKKLGLSRNKKSYKNTRRQHIEHDYCLGEERRMANNKSTNDGVASPDTSSPKATADVIDVDVSVHDSDATERRTRMFKDRIKRELDFELVPPKDITAWGPDGEVDGGIDARAQTAIGAKRQIQKAKQKLELKEDRVKDAKEDLLLIKSNSAQLKKKLLSQSESSKNFQVREKIKVMNLQVENASRILRRAQREAQAASEKVEALEQRHWILISQFEADTRLH